MRAAKDTHRRRPRSQRKQDMEMPAPDPAIIARRAEIARALRVIVPGEGVIDHPDELKPYESDGLTAYRQVPMLVVLPETTAQVSAILAWCHASGVKVVPRGSGTSPYGIGSGSSRGRGCV